MAKERKVYVNALVERNASRQMAELFGAQKKFGTWRRLWLELARAQKKLGLDIKQSQINEMARHTLGGNAPVSKIWPQLGPLLLLTAIVLFVGYQAFKFGFWKARDEGTLGHAMSGWHR